MRFLDALLFALTLSLTVPPVLCAPPAQVALAPRAAHAVLGVLAAAILMRRRAVRPRSPAAHRPKDAAARAVTMGAALVTFGVLCVSSAVMGAFAGGRPERAISSPKQLPLCIVTFLLAAFYEETVYRLYLPHMLGFTLKKLPHGEIIAEAVPVLLFAFAHKYSGWPSVANALVAAAALRLCLVRGRSLAACVGVHTAYNVLQLVLVWAVGR